MKYVWHKHADMFLPSLGETISLQVPFGSLQLIRNTTTAYDPYERDLVARACTSPPPWVELARRLLYD